MSKDNRSEVNPFTGKKHYDAVDDDEFLEECYNAYYNEVNQYELWDHTQAGQMVMDITASLIHNVEQYLIEINRLDYVVDYYDWEVHLVNSTIANACCYPGGKIIVYAGILEYMQSADELAFILAHEISHALLDHSRTQASVEKTKNSLSSVSWMGSIALDLMGFETAGDLVRAGVNIADTTSHYFLTKPWGRNQELEADKLGLIICYLAGYDVSVVPVFWQKFTEADSNESDFFSTHPSDDKRIAVMRESLMDMYTDKDFFLEPLLPETPKAKNEYKTENIEKRIQMNNNQLIQNNAIPQNHYDGVNNQNSNVAVHRFDSDYYCPGCKHSVTSNDRFCNNCGLDLNNLHCQNCGNRIYLTDNFCMYCGKKI